MGNVEEVAVPKEEGKGCPKGRKGAVGLGERPLLRSFNRACVSYHLLSDGDRILIALSGGKDSLMLARLMAQRARIYKPKITVEAAHVIMDNIPYETDRSYLQDFCYELGIRLHILHSRFDESTDPRKTRCFLCAWNRRKTLFEFAVANGFNKIALGHHNDDIIITYLMNITFEGSAHTMPCKSSVRYVSFMKMIFVRLQKNLTFRSRKPSAHTRKKLIERLWRRSSIIFRK